MRVAGATLIPGGGGRRTDCIMQMSAEGVGFPAGYGWSTGGNLAWFRSDNRLAPSFEPGLPPRGRYDLSRLDAGVFLSFHHPFLEPGIEVRRITYSQNPLSLNDYDATIVVFRLTRRFDF